MPEPYERNIDIEKFASSLFKLDHPNESWSRMPMIHPHYRAKAHELARLIWKGDRDGAPS